MIIIWLKKVLFTKDYGFYNLKFYFRLIQLTWSIRIRSREISNLEEWIQNLIHLGKVGCVLPMVVVPMLPRAEFRSKDHRDDALHLTI